MESSVDNTMTSIGKILRSNKRFEVPSYQRDFSWDVRSGNREAETLWNDILESYKENRKHFMGILILVESRDSLKVVDGQQRLATLSLLFSAFARYFSENNITSGLPESLLFDVITHTKRELRLHLTKPDRVVFENIIGGMYPCPFHSGREPTHKDNEDCTIRESRKKLHNVHNFFFEQISKEHETNESFVASNLLDHIIENLLFIKLVMSTLAEPVLFELLNNRGRKLSPVNLIKNHLICGVLEDRNPTKKADSANIPQKAEEISDEWDAMVETVQNPEQFVKHYIISVLNKRIGSSDIYGESIKLIKENEEFLKDICEAADCYSELENPSESKLSEKRKELLLEFSDLDIVQPLPLLLKLRRMPDSKKHEVEFDKILEKIITLQYRFSVSDKNPNKLENFYAGDLCKIVEGNSENVYENIISILNDKIEDDEHFKRAMKNHDFDNKLARYTMRKINMHLLNNGKKELSVVREEIQAEHIIPQRLDKKGWWKGFLHSEGLEHEKIVKKICNFTILLSDDNKIASNSPFDVKRDEVYSSSRAPTTKALGRKSFVLSKSKLRSLSNDYSKYACEIWPKVLMEKKESQNKVSDGVDEAQ